MGRQTKIDWCDSSWNPVTGCLHGCEYCYARGIANRFGRKDDQENVNHDLQNPLFRVYRDDLGVQHTGSKLAYPYGFDPTLHRYKLDEPQHWKKPRTIFVCSMADLFGEWVPDEWIKAVFDACTEAPQHRYLFLTKHPRRYMSAFPWYLSRIQRISKAFEAWFGFTYDGVANGEIRRALKRQYSFHQFISIEPILAPIWDDEIDAITATCDWVIIGAETGNRKGRVKPEKRWIMKMSEACEISGIPVFMKESLRGIMGDDFRQEFPWED